MMVSREYKYWMIAKVDWKNYKLLSIIDEKLFKVNENGIVDEMNNLVNEPKYQEIILDFKNKSEKFFARSSDFRKKFPISRFPNTIKI